MNQPRDFDEIVLYFRSILDNFPDKRTGKNKHYQMRDAALSAFSVFFTQTPSFLAYQRSMAANKGHSNAQSLFGVHQIPSDNHIRDLLDGVEPTEVFPVFGKIFQVLEQGKHLSGFRSGGGKLLIALDGTEYFGSNQLHCMHCSKRTFKNGTVQYFHAAITPVVVCPGNSKVISLVPEFIVPQDGHEKQDCENAAAKRWIEHYGKQYAHLGITVLGEIYTYRYVNQLPLRDGEDALLVNWCELTITRPDGTKVYKNAFATNYPITAQNVEALVSDGRARWKIENENNNTLKTKGYNLEHNFGHGKKHLSSLLATFNLLAFLFHTLLDLTDQKYQLIRQHLPTRKTFFDDLRALTRYLYFDSWDNLLSFMLQGLELDFPPNSS